MSITYYDHTSARVRIKPRYKWAVAAFVAGICFGALLVVAF